MPPRFAKETTELVALAPDVILTTGGSTMAALQQATRTLPVVFVSAFDPPLISFSRLNGHAAASQINRGGRDARWDQAIED